MRKKIRVFVHGSQRGVGGESGFSQKSNDYKKWQGEKTHTACLQVGMNDGNSDA